MFANNPPPHRRPRLELNLFKCILTGNTSISWKVLFIVLVNDTFRFHVRSTWKFSYFKRRIDDAFPTPSDSPSVSHRHGVKYPHYVLLIIFLNASHTSSCEKISISIYITRSDSLLLVHLLSVYTRVIKLEYNKMYTRIIYIYILHFPQERTDVLDECIVIRQCCVDYYI